MVTVEDHSPQSFMARGRKLGVLQLQLNLTSRLKMAAPREVGL
jgi:hypothetical protein